jgi:hypothetical protein
MLGLFPKKLTPAQLQKTAALWLSLALMVLLIFNIVRVGNFEQDQKFISFEQTYSKVELDESEAKEFKNLSVFEKGNFCGWHFSQEKNNIKTEKSSAGFSADKGIIINKNDDGVNLLVCLNKTSKKSQIIFALVLYAIIFLIVYPKFPKELENENEEISNTTEG